MVSDYLDGDDRCDTYVLLLRSNTQKGKAPTKQKKEREREEEKKRRKEELCRKVPRIAFAHTIHTKIQNAQSIHYPLSIQQSHCKITN